MLFLIFLLFLVIFTIDLFVEIYLRLNAPFRECVDKSDSQGRQYYRPCASLFFLSF